MFMQIETRDGGNAVVYTGTPDELRKRFTASRRRVERSGVPLCVQNRVDVWEFGSKYFLRLQSWGKWQIMQNGKYCAAMAGPGFEHFGHALRRYVEIVEAEREGRLIVL